MGIRFYCPNGHKLNVKSFLAGKRGICPHCGSKVDIPLESTRDSGKQKNQAVAGHLSVPVTGPAGASAPTAQPVPMARPAGAAQAHIPMAQPVAAATQPAPTQPIAAISPTSQAASAYSVQPIQPALVPAQPAPAPSMADPIAEAPQAVWYVRPASGGQYGPATGDVMQQWINEGRVAADSLVWREGWPDWKTAGQTFPKFAAASGATGQAWPKQGSPF